MSLGKRIQAARKAKGITQKQLAELIGVVTGTVQQYELDKRQPRFEQLEKIANNLDVSVGYLQGYENINTQQVVKAAINRDSKSLENLLGLPENSVYFLDEAEEELRQQHQNQLKEIDVNLNRLKFFIRIKCKKFTNTDLEISRQLLDAFFGLNEKGRKEAVKRIEELAEISRYQESPDEPAQK